jgi:hypothetical protein
MVHYAQYASTHLVEYSPRRSLIPNWSSSFKSLTYGIAD